MTAPTPSPPPPNHTSDDDLNARFRDVARVINAVRPSIQADGGDVELVDLTNDGTVKIRLHGACVGCPSSEMTLTEGIEKNVKAHVPSVKAVEAID